MSEGRFIVGTGLRGKVERLLKGEIRVGDLHDLIFDMRDEGGGSGVVSEVGNFIAHPLVRTQGIVWREVNDAVAFLRFRMSFDSSGKLVTYTISSSVPNLLRANLRRIRKPFLMRALGINRTQAGAILERVLGRLTPISEGRLSKLSVQTQEEYNVVSFRN